jgi:hypothetical protein
MKTALDWLIEQMPYEFRAKYANDLFKQAKELEKEQISKAWDDGDYAYFYNKETGRDFENGEEYYNQTYKPETI